MPYLTRDDGVKIGGEEAGSPDGLRYATRSADGLRYDTAATAVAQAFRPADERPALPLITHESRKKETTDWNRDNVD